MQINVTFDASVANAPAGFESAVEAAVAYLDSVIATPITVNIQFSWGEIAGQPMEPGALGESLPYGFFTNYAQLKSALAAVAASPDELASVASLPASDPTNGGDFFLTTSEAKALGLYPADASGIDGYVGLDSSASFTFDPNNRAVAGEYDAIGILEHEITEVLGRDATVGEVQTDATNLYSPLDLFRYASPGVRDLTPAGDFFSVNGTTLLSQFNDAEVNGGDAGDWAASVVGDSFDASTQPGVDDQVSATDLRVLDVLGFHSTAPTPVPPLTTPTPNVAAEAPITLTQNASVAQGQAAYFTAGAGVTQIAGYSLSGTPSLSNAGTITLISSAGSGSVNVGVAGSQHGALFSNASTGALYVEATGSNADAIGVEGGTGSPGLTNSGLIQVVSAAGSAAGFATEDPAAPFTNNASGLIKVWGGGQSAIGVDFVDGGAFSNAGTIQVTGQNAFGEEGATSFSNAGTIDATDVNGGWGSIGADVGTQISSLTNTGTIQADYVVYYDTSASNGVSANITVNNSGHMVGSVALANGNDQVINSGSITGDIYFGDGNSVYSGAGGTIGGSIYLGFGTNTVTLGAGPGKVFGGFGADTITGGTGNDFFEIGGGANKITGGSGFNVLSFADSPTPVTVNLATGAASADGGSDTISNIQEVIGSQNPNDVETLTAGAGAAVLIAGTGLDTLTGGAGNDTLVAGSGTDTLTGGGGHNTFVYQNGSGGATITDFNTDDVLDVYGAASASAVTQNGSAVDILVGFETVVLLNTTLSEITPGDVVYNAAQYPGLALPASLPTYGTNTIFIEKDMAIAPEATIDEQGEAYGFLNEGHSLDLKADSSVTVDYAVAALSDDVYGWADANTNALGQPINPTGDTVTVESGASFIVSELEGSAVGFAPLFATTFSNAGTINLTAAGTAYGVDTTSAGVTFNNGGAIDVEAPGGSYFIDAASGAVNLTNAVNGSIDVTSAGAAYGVDTSGGVSFINAGSFSIHGDVAAYGLVLGAGGLVANTGTVYVGVGPTNTSETDYGVDALSGVVDFTNGVGAAGATFNVAGNGAVYGLVLADGGQIVNDAVFDAGGGSSAYAIKMDQAQGHSLTNNGHLEAEVSAFSLSVAVDVAGTAGDPFTITNSGSISAVTAITEYAGASDGGQLPDLDIVNTGTITGAVDLFGNSDSLSNSGAGVVNGYIYLSDDSAGGSSPAGDTVDFSSGTAGIFIAPGTAGNIAIDDAMKLSGGWISIAAGESNLTVSLSADPGAAVSVDYDIASTAATWSQNADGSWTVHAGTDGTEMLNGVEQLIFTDRPVTLVGPSAVGNDFNADGRSDYLIENTSGVVVVGEVGAGDAAVYTQVSALGPEWTFVGDGDFLGDGRSGFLIENAAGAVDVGEVTGGQAHYSQVAALGPEWSFRGVGDFLGDGKSDFLIENTAGAVVVGEVGASGQAAYTDVAALGPEWSFEGVGDFLSDGKTQFLIENSAGAVDLGELGPGNLATYTQVAALGPEWKFVGVGDFLGGDADQFLIENAAGAVDIGQLGANGQASYIQITSLGPEWKFVGVGDYLGEGHDQFLIENAAGAVVIGDYAPGVVPHLLVEFTPVSALGPEWHFH